MSAGQKICAICLSLEAEYERGLEEVKRQCTEYTGGEPIFEDKQLNDLRKDDSLISGDYKDYPTQISYV